MFEQTLHNEWKMRQSGTDIWYPAKVPGTVCSDLLSAGCIPDPYYRDNEEEILKVMYYDYEYEAEFNVENEIWNAEHILLHFDGIDTIADIYLNGQLLGHVENMHREWEFEINKQIQKEKNKLNIILYSPVKYIKEAYKTNPLEGAMECTKGFPSIRKAHCMFGWDWGIRLPDAGIWRAVRLQGYSGARLQDVYIRQKHEKDTVYLQAEIKMTDAVDAEFHLEITDPFGERTVYPKNQNVIQIQNPQLWWPNGYGEQPLYTVKVAAETDGRVTDTWERRIGLRTMTMHICKDQYGEKFAHCVNGIDIFAMGADYIPEDSLISRISPQRTRDLLMQAKIANFNCIRVWGGGHYPHDGFWEACDELGLIVWQDFMFACAVYDLTEEFEENIVQECIDNIRRIRHHASLGLWCGNNEMELFVKQGEWVTKPKQVGDYIKMYEYVIPKVLKQYDPDTFYWPASPSSGGSFDEPNDENRGDVHYWEVWHGNKPFTEYRKFYFRYLSEFGFQSFPALKTCESFTEPGDRNIFSDVMEKHQRNGSANGKIMNYMEQMYLYPTSFATLIYASQLLQAQAIRYGVEHFRRNRGRCMGTVIWQFNDCWPVASWSSIDYYGRWKALHYYAKRFFAPVLLSCEEEGILTQDSNPNAEPYEVRKSVRFNVSNETMERKKVTVLWQLKNSKGLVKRSECQKLTVDSLSAVWLERTELSEAELREDYVSYVLEMDGKEISHETLIFCQPKNFRFWDPHLKCRAEGDAIVITADAYAKDVEILNETEDMILEKNYFDMEPGECRIRILSGKPEGLKIRSVYDIR